MTDRDMLPRLLYTAAGVRALDRAAIDGAGIPGRTLMERAGAAAFAELRRRWPSARRLLCLCGGGNNGGDGFVIARLARAAGLEVSVGLAADPNRLQGDALSAWQAMTEAGTEAVAAHPGMLAGADLVVDALLGTGIDRNLEGDLATLVSALNASGLPVLAVDVPSGLQADSGRVLGCAVRAAATMSFIGLKRGLFTGQGPDYCGAIGFNDLEVPETVYQAVPPAAERWALRDFGDSLPRRARDAHKGHFGHLLVVGGDHGFAGAARMAAEAGARVGCGLTSLATRPEHAALVAAVRPEIMAHGVEGAADLLALASRATVIAAGPGLGRASWARQLLAALLDLDRPLVLDADALNLLAADPVHRHGWVLTPHPGEAARLLGSSTAEVQADRFAAVAAIQSRYGGVCVLKGAGTLITDGRALPAVCTDGNPGMASGGMGDVLTGTIAGLLAQGLGPFEAARLGVCLHGAAGDAAAAEGERGLLATDLMPWLRHLVNARRP